MIRAIDLFAGCGGTTTGAHQTGAIQVVWAANHWPLAVDVHRANHPETEHSCQDLQQADFTKVPDFDLLLASPACQGHSRARGKERAHHDALRSTAWAVVSCLEARRPEAFVVENVPLFQSWDLYDLWLAALQRLGYQVTAQVLDAADFGVPQSRQRLFIVGHRGKAIDLISPELPHRPARSFIDWDEGDWRPVEAPGRSKHVLRQWHHGRPHHGERFLVAKHTSKVRGRSLDRPIGTITTIDHWGVIDGDRYRPLTIKEHAQAMSFPEHYVLPEARHTAIKLLGNAVPPKMARGILAQVAAAMGGAA